MLKTRVIPTLLWKSPGLVKGIGFDSWRRVGTILPAIKVYNTRQVDELIIVDITATKEHREPDYYEIEDFSSECFVPMTVGGGIQNIEQVKKILRVGADKISINSAAFTNSNLITEIAERFGSQCIVVSIDVKKIDNHYECFSHSGTKSTGIEVIDWVKEVEKKGAGEILITSIERDGTMTGYDLELLKQVAEAVKIPVIASGGAGNYEDIYKACKECKVSAIAAASIFHFTEQTPLGVKDYLDKRGIPVRKIS